MTKLSDKDLFLQIKEGNQTAFEIIFIRYYEKLCWYANDLLHLNELAEEVVQDSFVKVWEYRSQIKIDESVKAYLYRMVHNTCLNELTHLKVERNYRKRWQLANKYADVLTSASHDYPIANLLEKDVEKSIKQALDLLPEKCRKIFMLYRFQNMNYGEIAEEFNISENTVKTQIRRALSKLRESLKEFLIP